MGRAIRPTQRESRLRQGRALRRAAFITRIGCSSRWKAHRAEGLDAICADFLGRGAGNRRRQFSSLRARVRRRKRMAVPLRRHDGPRYARRDSPPDPCQALFRLLLDDLHQHRLARLHRRNRQADGTRSARNRQGRLRRHLGHQRRRHPGQCHDPRDPRAQRARRENRRHRHLSQRNDEAGGYRNLPASWYGRRFRLRGHACSLSRRPRRSRLSQPLYRRAGRIGGASSDPRSAMGEHDHRPRSSGNRGLRASRGNTQAHLLSSWLRLLAPAQRRAQPARRHLHRVGDRPQAL